MMCVVSMVMDHYSDKWDGLIRPSIMPNYPFVPFTIPVDYVKPTITPEEIAEFKRLMERAREYDRKNNEPDCELAEKRQLLQKLADELGVDISFINSNANGVSHESN